MKLMFASDIHGSASDFLYNLLIQLLGREKVYAVEEPGYGKIRKIYAAITCTVAHAWYEVKTKSEWYFYGHGTSGEPWKPEQNDKNGVCHFNAVWGPKAFLLPERKLYEFSRPEDLEL